MMQTSKMENPQEEYIVKRVSVPTSLEELMNGLTIEILKKQPKDIIVCASEYFSKLLKLREEGYSKITSVRARSSAMKLPSHNGKQATNQTRNVTRPELTSGIVAKSLNKQTVPSTNKKVDHKAILSRYLGKKDAMRKTPSIPEKNLKENGVQKQNIFETKKHIFSKSSSVNKTAGKENVPKMLKKPATKDVELRADTSKNNLSEANKQPDTKQTDQKQQLENKNKTPREEKQSFTKALIPKDSSVEEVGTFTKNGYLAVPSKARKRDETQQGNEPPPLVVPTNKENITSMQETEEDKDSSKHKEGKDIEEEIVAKEETISKEDEKLDKVTEKKESTGEQTKENDISKETDKTEELQRDKEESKLVGEVVLPPAKTAEGKKLKAEGSVFGNGKENPVEVIATPSASHGSSNITDVGHENEGSMIKEKLQEKEGITTTDTKLKVTTNKITEDEFVRNKGDADGKINEGSSGKDNLLGVIDISKVKEETPTDKEINLETAEVKKETENEKVSDETETAVEGITENKKLRGKRSSDEIKDLEGEEKHLQKNGAGTEISESKNVEQKSKIIDEKKDTVVTKDEKDEEKTTYETKEKIEKEKLTGTEQVEKDNELKQIESESEETKVISEAKKNEIVEEKAVLDEDEKKLINITETVRDKKEGGIEQVIDEAKAALDVKPEERVDNDAEDELLEKTVDEHKDITEHEELDSMKDAVPKGTLPTKVELTDKSLEEKAKQAGTHIVEEKIKKETTAIEETTTELESNNQKGRENEEKLGSPTEKAKEAEIDTAEVKSTTKERTEKETTVIEETTTKSESNEQKGKGEEKLGGEIQFTSQKTKEKGFKGNLKLINENDIIPKETNGEEKQTDDVETGSKGTVTEGLKNQEESTSKGVLENENLAKDVQSDNKNVTKAEKEITKEQKETVKQLVTEQIHEKEKPFNNVESVSVEIAQDEVIKEKTEAPEEAKISQSEAETKENEREKITEKEKGTEDAVDQKGVSELINNRIVKEKPKIVEELTEKESHEEKRIRDDKLAKDISEDKEVVVKKAIEEETVFEQRTDVADENKIGKNEREIKENEREVQTIDKKLKSKNLEKAKLPAVKEIIEEEPTKKIREDESLKEKTETSNDGKTDSRDGTEIRVVERGETRTKENETEGKIDAKEAAQLVKSDIKEESKATDKLPQSEDKLAKEIREDEITIKKASQDQAYKQKTEAAHDIKMSDKDETRENEEKGTTIQEEKAKEDTTDEDQATRLREDENGKGETEYGITKEQDIAKKLAKEITKDTEVVIQKTPKDGVPSSIKIDDNENAKNSVDNIKDTAKVQDMENKQSEAKEIEVISEKQKEEILRESKEEEKTIGVKSTIKEEMQHLNKTDGAADHTAEKKETTKDEEKRKEEIKMPETIISDTQQERIEPAIIKTNKVTSQEEEKTNTEEIRKGETFEEKEQEGAKKQQEEDNIQVEEIAKVDIDISASKTTEGEKREEKEMNQTKATHEGMTASDKLKEKSIDEESVKSNDLKKEKRETRGDDKSPVVEEPIVDKKVSKNKEAADENRSILKDVVGNKEIEIKELKPPEQKLIDESQKENKSRNKRSVDEEDVGEITEVSDKSIISKEVDVKTHTSEERHEQNKDKEEKRIVHANISAESLNQEVTKDEIGHSIELVNIGVPMAKAENTLLGSETDEKNAIKPTRNGHDNLEKRIEGADKENKGGDQPNASVSEGEGEIINITQTFTTPVSHSAVVYTSSADTSNITSKNIVVYNNLTGPATSDIAANLVPRENKRVGSGNKHAEFIANDQVHLGNSNFASLNSEDSKGDLRSDRKDGDAKPKDENRILEQKTFAEKDIEQDVSDAGAEGIIQNGQTSAKESDASLDDLRGTISTFLESERKGILGEVAEVKEREFKKTTVSALTSQTDSGYVEPAETHKAVINDVKEDINKTEALVPLKDEELLHKKHEKEVEIGTRKPVTSDLTETNVGDDDKNIENQLKTDEKSDQSVTDGNMNTSIGKEVIDDDNLPECHDTKVKSKTVEKLDSTNEVEDTEAVLMKKEESGKIQQMDEAKTRAELFDREEKELLQSDTKMSLTANDLEEKQTKETKLKTSPMKVKVDIPTVTEEGSLLHTGELHDSITDPEAKILRMEVGDVSKNDPTKEIHPSETVSERKAGEDERPKEEPLASIPFEANIITEGDNRQQKVVIKEQKGNNFVGEENTENLEKGLKTVEQSKPVDELRQEQMKPDSESFGINNKNEAKEPIASLENNVQKVSTEPLEAVVPSEQISSLEKSVQKNNTERTEVKLPSEQIPVLKEDAQKFNTEAFTDKNDKKDQLYSSKSSVSKADELKESQDSTATTDIKQHIQNEKAETINYETKDVNDKDDDNVKATETISNETKDLNKRVDENVKPSSGKTHESISADIREANLKEIESQQDKDVFKTNEDLSKDEVEKGSTENESSSSHKINKRSTEEVSGTRSNDIEKEINQLSKSIENPEIEPKTVKQAVDNVLSETSMSSEFPKKEHLDEMTHEEKIADTVDTKDTSLGTEFSSQAVENFLERERKHFEKSYSQIQQSSQEHNLLHTSELHDSLTQPEKILIEKEIDKDTLEDKEEMEKDNLHLAHSSEFHDKITFPEKMIFDKVLQEEKSKTEGDELTGNEESQKRTTSTSHSHNDCPLGNLAESSNDGMDEGKVLENAISQNRPTTAKNLIHTSTDNQSTSDQVSSTLFSNQTSDFVIPTAESNDRQEDTEHLKSAEDSGSEKSEKATDISQEKPKGINGKTSPSSVNSTSIIIQTEQLNEASIPLSIQLNQDPAGAASVTSAVGDRAADGDDEEQPTPVATAFDGSGSSDARKDATQPHHTDASGRAVRSADAPVSSEMEAKRNNASINDKNMEEIAATKIQASFRGYQVRKQLKSKNGGTEAINQGRVSRRKNSGKIRASDAAAVAKSLSQQKPSDIEERSATKIQAGIRGFLVRRRQKKEKPNTTPESS